MDILFFLSYKPRINSTVKNNIYLLNFTVQLNLLAVKLLHRTVKLLKQLEYQGSLAMFNSLASPVYFAGLILT